MTKFKYTPGPWEAVLCNDDADSTYIEPIDFCFDRDYDFFSTDLMPENEQQEIHANARLLSCAPEMVETMIEVIKINRHRALDRYGDREIAMEWSCQKIMVPLVEKATGVSIREILK